MKTRRSIVVLLVVSLAFLPACSASLAHAKLDAFQQQQRLNTEAWIAARARLQAMCPAPPTSVEEYRNGVAARAAGTDPFRGCDVRVVKLTNSPRTDDWQWQWLPSYQTIVAVHDEELRRRVTPRVYDEYTLGISRFLAEKADAGVITPAQIMAAFNKVWIWMSDQARREAMLLEDSMQAANRADAAAWNTLNTIAAGLALVATTALVVGAASRPAPPPPPILCHARQLGQFVSVYCQ